MDENIQIKEEVEEEVMTTTNKIIKKEPYSIEESVLKSTTDDVQRAIKGLKEIPDEELKEFLDDEDFALEGLDVVDTWEGEEDRHHDNEQDPTRLAKQRENPSREHHAEPKGSNKRKKSKKEDKKREEIRRDPSKSSKDIERDKIRTKRDTESKLLAEKEKAIKCLLDSDKVVPPGTETEAIQSIAEEQRERAQREAQRNRERRRSKSLERYRRLSSPRRRTPDRLRQSPPRRKSPLSPERRRSPRYSSPARRKNSPRSYDRRSPIVSPDRRRSPRRLSVERRSSVDRRWSSERRRRRADWTHERRRSRSYDRRSRSTERSRRRSSRSPASRRSPSHSPVNRRYNSPRHRSRTRSRSRSLEKRPRKRSPFLNELVRQLNRSNSTTGNASGYVSSATMEGIAPLFNPPTYQQETEPRPPLPRMTPPPQPPPPPPPPSSAPPYIHQPLPPLPPPSSSAMLPPIPSGQFMNFESMPGSLGPPSSYSSGPILYNQPTSIQAPPPPMICSPMHSMPTPSPQPVPPPMMDAHKSYGPSYSVPFVQQPVHQPPVHQSTNISLNEPMTSTTSSQSYTERGPTPSSSSYNESRSPRPERMLTPPEPPVISMPQQKTSLSSLLEASVSAKESANIPVLYPGFKKEIMQNCEKALYHLTMDDPRLKMKGRFFYDRTEEKDTKDILEEDHTSNSILLQKSKTKIFWAESNADQPVPVPKTAAQMHQKICQTDEVMTETKGVQVRAATADVASQVKPEDLQQVKVKEEKRPIMERLDWSTRDTYEYGSKYREKDDLRWSLNNSQRRTWNRQKSPDDEPVSKRFDSRDESENLRLNLPATNRDEFSTHSTMRDHYARETYSPEAYRTHSMERDEFHDRRSDHSRGESPMDVEKSDEELMPPGHTFQRESEWHEKGKILKGKSHNLREKHGGKPHRSHESFRGKF